MPCPSRITAPRTASAGASAGARRRGELGEAHDRVRAEQAGDREDGQQPAPEEARLGAHVEHVEDRRGAEDEQGAAVVDGEQAQAHDGGHQRHPAQPPGEGPQVVEVPGALGQPELAQRVVGGVGLVLQAIAEGREVEHGIGVGDHEGGQGDDPRQHEPTGRGVAPRPGAPGGSPRPPPAAAGRSRRCTSSRRPAPAPPPPAGSRAGALRAARPPCPTARARSAPASARR